MTFTRFVLYAGTLLTLSATSAAAAPAFVLSNVNLRSGPATTNDVVVRIPAGSVVEAVNCTDGWCAVTWQDKNGFAIQTALDMSGRPHALNAAPGAYPPAPAYAAAPVYVAPAPVYYGPAYGYYGPYYGGWGWHRRW
jgi:uncharacterized protein YraI